MLAICIAAYVIDGDSIRCRNLGQVRLLGIDAPDRTSSRPCREGFGDHICDDRGAAAAKSSLRAAVRGMTVTVEIVGRDRYRRALVLAWAGKINLNCAQLRARAARYVVKYDNGRLIRATCPVLAR